MGLSPTQIAVLKALADEPSASLYAQQYMKRHHLGSIGGVQTSLKKLELLDLVEKQKNKTWKIVDPLFQRWLQENGR